MHIFLFRVVRSALPLLIISSPFVGGCSSPATQSGSGGGDAEGPTCHGVAPMDGRSGHGLTLGGCPADEPAPGSACTVEGRMCTWLRHCSGAETTDTGWCTATGSWQVALGQCSKGCPSTRDEAVSRCDDDGPCDDHCQVGLTCHYPSTPLEPGISSKCEAVGSQTSWPDVPDSWNDCWVPARGSSELKSCTELAACSGSTGCGDSCPNPAPRTCGCGPDGHLYCQVGPKC